MSKKILKRSLALGALMAFVITGNVWAREIDGMEVGAKYDSETKNSNRQIIVTPSAFENGYIDTNVVFESIDKKSHGSAVYVKDDGVFTISWSDFLNNEAVASGHPYGAAICNDGSTVTIDRCYFEGNVANFDGSGDKAYGSVIANTGACTTTIKNSVFKDNDGGRTNGLVYVRGNSDLFIENVKFVDNNKACINVESGSDLYVQGVNTFEKNTSQDIINKGYVKFQKGSTTEFLDSAYNIWNRGSGNIEVDEGAKITSNGGIQSEGSATVNGIVELGSNSHFAKLDGDGGTIRYLNDIDLTVTKNTATNLKIEASGEANDAVGGKVSELIGEKFGANEDENVEESKRVVILTMDEGDATGRVTAKLVNKGGYLQVESQTEEINTKNQAIGEAGVALKLHHRAHMNDMNKRMGELRNANGEHGVWVRMVRGESEYENTKAQYNQYQLGYDEKLSVDKRWTVGAAVTFAEGDANYGKGTTDDKSTAFAIYGSKLNNDGTFVDLIARYAHLESDLDDVHSGKGDYSTNGMSVSAEFGKRIQQGNGLWIEPQLELTYGTVDGADFKLGKKTVHVGEMDSLIARAGFSLGKDIKQGNVYARASYLYDFDGETVNAFTASGTVRPIEEDLGGGWWEVGVGANINLSKATYIYADIEKTFGGEVDTNWQWNLGVRYSF